MKKGIVAIMTLLILIGASYLVANLLNVQFMDIAFFVGLIGTVMIRFFSSSGGYMSKQMDMQIQGHTGIKMNHEQKRFSPNTVFYTCLLYTIVTAIFTFLHYKDYFFN